MFLYVLSVRVFKPGLFLHLYLTYTLWVQFDHKQKMFLIGPVSTNLNMLALLCISFLSMQHTLQQRLSLVTAEVFSSNYLVILSVEIRIMFSAELMTNRAIDKPLPA